MEPLAAVDTLKAAFSKIVLFPGAAGEATVRGTNKLKPPGYTRAVLDVIEHNKDFDTQEAGGGKYLPISGGGNMLVDDRTGQDIIRAYLKAGTRWTNNIRFYLTAEHFFTAALDRDLNAGFECVKWDAGEADKNGIYPVEFEFVVTGAVAIYSAHITATTLAFVDSDPDTITDSGAGLVLAKFADDMSLIVEGSASNDGQYHCDTAAAGVLTLNSHASLAVEVAGASVTIHGGLV